MEQSPDFAVQHIVSKCSKWQWQMKYKDQIGELIRTKILPFDKVLSASLKLLKLRKPVNLLEEPCFDQLMFRLVFFVAIMHIPEVDFDQF